jgi:hypothetical protein
MNLNDSQRLSNVYEEIINELNERDYLNGMSLEVSQRFTRILQIIKILKDNLEDNEILSSFVDEIKHHIIGVKNDIAR